MRGAEVPPPFRPHHHLQSLPWSAWSVRPGDRRPPCQTLPWRMPLAVLTRCRFSWVHGNPPGQGHLTQRFTDRILHQQVTKVRALLVLDI